MVAGVSTAGAKLDKPFVTMSIIRINETSIKKNESRFQTWVLTKVYFDIITIINYLKQTLINL